MSNLFYILIGILMAITIMGVFKFYPTIKEFLVNKCGHNKVPVEEVEVTKRIFSAKSKCFDCERQINKFNKSKFNLIHPTKCFDCEKQINKKYNNSKSNLGHSSKCFSCEN